AINLTGTVTLFVSGTLTVNDTAGVTISGTITEANGGRSLTVAGTGITTVPNPNLFSSGFTISAGGPAGRGIVAVGNNASGVNAVQTLTFAGTINNSSTFTLTFDGQTTAPISYVNSSTLATNIAAQLVQLSNIGSASNISVVANASGTIVTV